MGIRRGVCVCVWCASVLVYCASKWKVHQIRAVGHTHKFASEPSKCVTTKRTKRHYNNKSEKKTTENGSGWIQNAKRPYYGPACDAVAHTLTRLQISRKKNRSFCWVCWKVPCKIREFASGCAALLRHNCIIFSNINYYWISHWNLFAERGFSFATFTMCKNASGKRMRWKRLRQGGKGSWGRCWTRKRIRRHQHQ